MHGYLIHVDSLHLVFQNTKCFIILYTMDCASDDVMFF